MGESERESETESERPLISLSYVSLSLSLKWFRNGAFVISFFPQRQRQTQSGEKGQRGRILEGKGWGVEGEGKREASGQYTRTRANFKAKHPKGGEKERRERNYWGTTFFFFFFFLLFLFFFSVLERGSKEHDFTGLCYNQGQSSQSSQLDKSRESRESRAREKREREAGVVCTCAHVSVRVFLCVFGV